MWEEETEEGREGGMAMRDSAGGRDRGREGQGVRRESVGRREMGSDAATGCPVFD